MTDYISLALKYGGFTSLDKVYLQNVLEDLTDEQKLSFITPPPSVINAYFAEMYQKQISASRNRLYFELSKELQLLNDKPSFDEHKPFIRLNLSGKSYGFTYENDKEVARIFSEKDEALTKDVLFELAQVFPQYKIYVEDGKIKMSKITFDDQELEDLTPESSLLSHVSKLKGNMVKLKSFNRDELSDLLAHYQGQVYYTFDQREFIAYVKVS